MAPTIHCVRHAQGYHNLSTANHSLRDPLLTTTGEEQCRQLEKAFPNLDQVDLIVASPLKRTIYTALLTFESVIARKGLRIIALPELQETSDLPCDTGSTREELAKELENQPVDLSLVQPGWDSKRMQWAPYAKAIEGRARIARQWLMNRSEKHVVVVTHGGFLHYFTEDWTDNDRFTGTGWANTEFRTYTFSPQDAENAHLVETMESRARRVGNDDASRPLSREEQANLKEVATKEWERQGYVSAAAAAAAATTTTAHEQARAVQAKFAGRRRDVITNGC